MHTEHDISGTEFYLKDRVGVLVYVEHSAVATHGILYELSVGERARSDVHHAPRVHVRDVDRGGRALL